MARLNIGIWGFGKEGQVSYRYAKTHYKNAQITILDNRNIKPEELIDQNDRSLSGNEALKAISQGKFDTIIKSPGISLYKDEAQQAKKNGTKFTSATNIWLEEHPNAKTLIITGTKGKSTTASLIHHLLQSMGKDVILAGNIGTVLLDQKPAQDLNIIELSSYQIADLETAPNFALFLNLFPEHLGWHKTHENYFSDKLRLLTLSQKTTNIINGENDNILKRYSLKTNDVTYTTTDTKDYDCPLKGEHNKLNIAAALITIEKMGFNKSESIKHLPSFLPLPHRQEVLGKKDGITYVNDSISTIPESTLEALKLYRDQDITLLLGGEERGQNYKDLYSYLKQNSQINIILLPDNGKRIQVELKNNKDTNKAILIENFEHAVRHAQKTTPKGGIILLSPAAPSYGHFKNFEDRGNQFKKLYNT